MDRFHFVLLLLCLSLVETAGQRFVRREKREDRASVAVGPAGDLLAGSPAEDSLEGEEAAVDLGGEREARSARPADRASVAVGPAGDLSVGSPAEDSLEGEEAAVDLGDEREAAGEDGPDATLLGDEQAAGEDGFDAMLLGDEQACASEIANPPETSRRYSTVYKDNPIGTRRARSMLNSPEAWVAKGKKIGEWMDIDLGKVRTVQGTIVQGRRNYNQWVTKYKVKHSVDGRVWKDEPGVIQGSSGRHPKVKHAFPKAFAARYVRFIPQAWVRHMSMRAGVVVCKAQKAPRHYCSRHVVLREGRSLHNMRGSPKECERKCDQLKRCKSFTFVPPRKHCWLKDGIVKASDPANPSKSHKHHRTYYPCPLAATAAAPTPAPPTLAPPTPAPPTPPPGPRRYCPRNLVQDAGKGCGHATGGVEVCKQKCDQIKRCHSFTLHLHHGECWLKEKNVHASESANTSSHALPYRTYYLCAHPPHSHKSKQPDPWAAGPPTPGSAPSPQPHKPTGPCSR